MTLPLMLEEFDRVIVVDWSCPQQSGDWAEEQGAQVVRVAGERYFSPCRARNVGFRHVGTEFICFVDADVLVMPGAGKEIERLVNRSVQVIAARDPQNNDVHALGGFIALDSSEFLKVGCYDERLRGYALEDIQLRCRLLLERGILPKRVSPGALAVIRHSNEMRGRYLDDDVQASATRNHASLMSYLAEHGISDWLTDPKTQEIAYRV